MEADAEQHLRGGGALRGRRLGGAGELGAEDLQRRERVVHGDRSRPRRRWQRDWGVLQAVSNSLGAGIIKFVNGLGRTLYKNWPFSLPGRARPAREEMG